MSTILSKRNITVQKNIKEVVDIEDMRTFLKCFHSVQKDMYTFNGVLDSTAAFRSLWSKISGSDNLDRFNSTYNLPEWECYIECTQFRFLSSIHIKRTIHREIFNLTKTGEVYILIISSLYCRDMYRDKIRNTLRQIDGVREMTYYDYNDDIMFEFEIDFNKL